MEYEPGALYAWAADTRVQSRRVRVASARTRWLARKERARHRDLGARIELELLTERGSLRELDDVLV